MANDKVTGWLRTVVPIAWGYVVAWLIALIPGAYDFLTTFGIDLNSVATVNFVTGIAAAAWYAVFRWLEPRLPAWLTRVVLGSNQAPVYVADLTEDEYLDEGDVSPEDPEYVADEDPEYVEEDVDVR